MNLNDRYLTQKHGAAKRNIEWLLTFEQWLKIWLDSGHLEERGNKKNQYCMSRYGDIGPYSVDNVFIQKHGENTRQAHTGRYLPHRHNPCSQEKRDKISKALKGKPLKIETRLKMSKTRTGKIASIETKQRMSDAQKLRRQKELTNES